MRDDTRVRLHAASRRMAALSAALAFIIPPLIVFGVFTGIRNESGLAGFEGAFAHAAGMGAGAKTGVYVLNGMLALILSTALWRLHRTFSHLATETPQLGLAAAQMTSAGRWFLAAALFGIVASSGSILLATLHLPQGQRLVSIGVGTSELLGVLVAGTLLALGQVVALTARLDAENREFI